MNSFVCAQAESARKDQERARKRPRLAYFRGEGGIQVALFFCDGENSDAFRVCIGKGLRGVVKLVFLVGIRRGEWGASS